MFADQLISLTVPVLRPTDIVSTALREMENTQLSHLPLVQDDKYLGLVSEEVLLDCGESELLKTLLTKLERPSVRSTDYFLLAAKRIVQLRLTVIPVANEEEYLGTITERDLFQQLAVFAGVDETGGIIVLEMEKNAFSLGELNRLVESNDAYITQLNTQLQPSQLLTVTIRINKSEVSDIVATLQRYEYNVRLYFGEELYQNEIQSNYNNLINYLNI